MDDLDRGAVEDKALGFIHLALHIVALDHRGRSIERGQCAHKRAHRPAPEGRGIAWRTCVAPAEVVAVVAGVVILGLVGDLLEVGLEVGG